MRNPLFHRLAQTIRKQRGVTSAVVPFALGRVYKTRYLNYKHDSRPLLLILGSDAFYTIGININYLGPWKSSMVNFILALRQSQQVYTGYLIYQILKRRFPMIPKTAFRKYFTGMLRGNLVSPGISTLPEPGLIKSFTFGDAWTRRLNSIINRSNVNKFTVNEQALEDVRNDAIQTQYNKSQSSRPYSNRVRIQYRK
jgi:hypothetical protein